MKAPAVGVAARSVSFEGAASRVISRDVPVEVAVNVMFNGAPFAVMMLTPSDLEDFAFGFSFTEGVIAAAADVVTVDVVEQPKGLELRVTLREGLSGKRLERERNTEGRTGCGVCGIESLDALPMAAVRTQATNAVDLEAVKRAVHALDARQVLNAQTHAVHAAAWSSNDGTLVTVREDVGRHNALDKLIGALLRAGRSPSDGFLVITSRCSFEMVEKAAAFGARTLVAISAPTSLAIERAVEHDLTLLAVARKDGALVFHGAERLTSGGA